MRKGKQTCRILKQIRKQIAEANGIDFIISECKYHGDCLGTCPKCESEVQYLEEQLECRRQMGKIVILLGLSASLVTMNVESKTVAPLLGDTSIQIEQMTPIVLLKGVVEDAKNNPIIGASVQERGTDNGMETDNMGRFTIRIPVGHILKVSYVGYKTREIIIKRNRVKPIIIKLRESLLMMGECPIVNPRKSKP